MLDAGYWINMGKNLLYYWGFSSSMQNREASSLVGFK